MNLRIIKAGILDTVQDLGRFGWQHAGVNPTGVMDRFSAQAANIVVGNKREEAVIELHFPASEFFFEQAALIAISGADFTATVNGDEVPNLQPILVSKYSILQFHRLRSGARAYLAVRGGFDIPLWLNSRSTHIKAIAGGFQGRPLQRDDEIRLGESNDLTAIIEKKEFIIMPWKIQVDWDRDTSTDDNTILLLPGPEWHLLDERSKEALFDQPFILSGQSDRMGYRLQGHPLTTTVNEEMISSTVSFGTIQLLPDGQLIILMADHQTTGGYPRIGHVISAHLPVLAQLRPGERIHFSKTDTHTAEELMMLQEQRLQQLQNACNFKLESFLR